MSRALFVGGFSANERMLEPVGEAFGRSFEDVDVLTLRQARKDPDKVKRAAKGIPVFTHSGGIGPLEGTRPAELHAMGAPLTSSRLALLLRTVKKQIHMHSVNHSKAARFEVSTGLEIASHPLFHLKELGKISGMDCVGIAAELRSNGSRTNLAFFHDDRYFQPTTADIERAEEGDVRTLFFPGQHDELVLNPQQTVDDYLAQAG